MCYFCDAQLFEIAHVAKIKSTLVQHSCRNAEVVEAFCPVAASRSNTRRSIHQPPVAALHAPAETPTALSSVPRYAEMHVASCSRRAYHRQRRRHATLIALARCSAGCHTSRDFVPWRFLDAGQLSLRSVSSLPASKNQHNNRLMRRSKRHLCSITSSVRASSIGERSTPEYLRSLEIDDQLKFVRKFDRQVTRLGTF